MSEFDQAVEDLKEINGILDELFPEGEQRSISIHHYQMQTCPHGWPSPLGFCTDRCDRRGGQTVGSSSRKKAQVSQGEQPEVEEAGTP